MTSESTNTQNTQPENWKDFCMKDKNGRFIVLTPEERKEIEEDRKRSEGMMNLCAEMDEEERREHEEEIKRFIEEEDEMMLSGFLGDLN